MRNAGGSNLWCVTRAATLGAGLLALIALRPPLAPAGAPPTTSFAARALVLSDQARRFLALQYRAYSTEFLGCMIGEVSGTTVVVRRIAPADVDPAQSTRTHVIPRTTCEAAGWSGTVGIVHSHPGGESCFYYFPGTEVASSDARAFEVQAYPVDAIMCGDRIVWIGRDLVEHNFSLTERSSAAAVELRRGNPVHEGSAQ
jgi:hypothetical protein